MRRLNSVENYLIINGTNVNNMKLQGLLFFVKAWIKPTAGSTFISEKIYVENNFVCIYSSFYAHKDNGDSVLSASNYAFLRDEEKQYLDIILDTYDQFTGDELMTIIQKTGLLDNVTGELSTGKLYSFFRKKVKSNIKLISSMKLRNHSEFVTLINMQKLLRIIYLIFSLFSIILVILELTFDWALLKINILLFFTHLIGFIFFLSIKNNAFNVFKRTLEIEKDGLTKNTFNKEIL